MSSIQNTASDINPPKLSVVVPCFNEQDVLRKAHERISAICNETVDDSYELIYVNDGSRDATWALMKELAVNDPKLVCVDLSRNFGHQAALMTGLQLTKGLRVFVLDADLQDPPELLPEMMKAMDAGSDVVYGLRRRREGEDWFKIKSAGAFYKVLNALSDVEIPKDVGDFRLMKRKVVDALLMFDERKPYVRGLVAWAGFRQDAIQYDRNARTSGKSNYSLMRMISLALDGITGFSVIPLRAISLIAFFSLIITLCLIVYIFYVWATLDVVPGWTSLMVFIAFVASVQLLALGVIGEYVGRCYMETKHRPIAVINRIYTNNHVSE